MGGTGNAVFAARTAMLALILLGLYVSPIAGAIALCAFHLQPAIIFAGLPLRPPDLLTTTLFRVPIEIRQWAQMLRSRLQDGTSARQVQEIERRRPLYADMLKNGTGAFFEPRRSTCPLCDSPRLRTRLRTTDLVQHKPGEFALDECAACGHIFQNPRLSTAGIRFYYSDFYDGLSTPVAQTLMRWPLWMYLSRARSIGDSVVPTRWLDVGTSHAHFCCAAREAWPNTRFDGLDIGVAVEEAQRAGWVSQAYRGFFPDLATQLAGQYDVVSLFHCLEHTPDPRAEIAAAYTALAPGGLLVIEVPDPEAPAARIFGRFWFPWFQPQHLHLLSVENSSKLLRAAGFEPVLVQRNEVHIQIDFFTSLMGFYSWVAPKLNAPWLPPPRLWQRVRNSVVWTLGAPFVPIALLLDVMSAPLVRRLGWSTAYRIVARRDDRPVDVRGPASAPLHSKAIA
jgi:SAM-dependent methyltransferase